MSFGRNRFEANMNDEMRFHLECRIEDLTKSGMEPDEARRIALIEFGGIDRTKDECRDVRWTRRLEELATELRYTTRTLSNSPGFTASVVLTLALGIGATSAIFAVVNGILLRELPFQNSDQLVIIEQVNQKDPQWAQNPALSVATEWKQRAKSFDGMEMAVAYSEEKNLSGDGEVERVQAQYVTPGLLPLLGIKPFLGRGFISGETAEGNSYPILISHGLWERRFGASPAILGTTVRLSGKVCSIVGVLPPGTWVFPSTEDPPVWAPLEPMKANLTPDTRYLTVIARLKRDVTLRQAQAEMNVLGESLTRAFPEINQGWAVRVEILRNWCFGYIKGDMLLLLGAVGLVFLIACANAASLIVVRGMGRRKEIAIRAALGASRGRVAVGLLVECLVLAVMGGVVGLFVCAGGIRIFIAVAHDLPRSNEIRIDAAVLGFTLALSLATAALFGLIPALRLSKADLVGALTQSGQRAGEISRDIGKSALVVCEIALTLILLMGAGLTMKSFLHLLHVNPGFNVKGLLTADIEVLDQKYVEILPQNMRHVSPCVDTFYEDLLGRIERIPGVRSAAMQGASRDCPFRIIDRPQSSAEEEREAVFEAVSPSYFRTLQQPLLYGREFTRNDSDLAPWVAIVNETMAHRFFRGDNPIGRVIHVAFTPLSKQQLPEDRPREIVGIVADTKQFGPMNEAQPTIYVPDRQHNAKYPGGAVRTHVTRSLIVRMDSIQPRFTEFLRKTVAEIDPDQSVNRVMSMEQSYGQSLSTWRFFLRVFGIFSAIALFLAAVGIYGLVSYSVGRRTHEFAVRLAIGARRVQIAQMVLSRGLVLTASGILIGVTGALAMTKLIAHLLWNTKSADPTTLAIVCLILGGISLLASLIPAWRAIRVDPIVILRSE